MNVLKKIVFLLTVCLMAAPAWGEKVVTFQTESGCFYPTVIPIDFTSDGVTLSVYGTPSPPGFMYYGDNHMSCVTTVNGYITSITFEHPQGGFLFANGSYSYGTWSGQARMVAFTSSGYRSYSGRVFVTVEGDTTGTDPDPGDDGKYKLITIYQNGLYLYAQALDGEPILLYGHLNGTFVNGDTITGYANEVIYNDIVVLTPISDWELVGHGPEVLPEEIPIEELDFYMVYKYLGFRGVQIEEGDDSYYLIMSDETGSIIVFNKFYINICEPDLSTGEVDIALLNQLIDVILDGGMPESPDTYDVKGFLARYISTLEFLPISIVRNRNKVADYDFNGDGEVNITDVNTVIDYILSH